MFLLTHLYLIESSMLIDQLKKLRTHNGFIKYFKNISWLFAEKLLRMIVGLFVGIWVARYLGPEQFGLLSYALSFVGLFIAISTMGLGEIVIRELVNDENRRDELLGTAFWLKLIGAFSVLIILAIAINFTSNDQQTNILIFIIASATIFQSFNVIDFFFQSKVLSKFVAYANMISLFTSSIIKITLIIVEAPLIHFAYVISFDSLVLAMGYIFYYLNNNLSLRKWRFDKTVATALLLDSWPLIFGSIAASIYMRIDQVMIKELINTKAVGYYSVAVRLCDLWLFVTMVLTQTLSPSIIKAKKINQALYLSKLQDMYNLLIKLSFLISIIMSLFARKIVLILYGVEYAESIKILLIYIWSINFVFLSNASWAYYINENLQKIASLRLIYGSIINIILNVILIRYYGLIGAAISTIISYSVSSYFINYFFKKTKLNFKLQTKAILNIFNINTWLNPLNIKGKI